MKITSTFLTIFLSIPLFLCFPQKALKNYNFSAGKQIKLDKSLMEISGIVFVSGKLYAHDDEYALIYQLDPNSGKILKSFSVGNPVIHGDFEEICFANDKFYLTTSVGEIYSFFEAGNGKSVAYKKYSTGLTNLDIEGLCYDESTNSLLIAGKKSPGKGFKKEKLIYSFGLQKNSINTTPRFYINVRELKKSGIEKFSPSGITKNNKTGTFFVLSSKEQSIIELSDDGKIISSVKLDRSKHIQPEGICFSPEGSLYISDEGAGGLPVLTIYK